MAKTQDKQQQTEIDVSPNVFTAGSNTAVIRHDEEEFSFLFGNRVPTRNPQGAVRVHSIINLTPAHAKRFLAALAANIQKYEAQHGEIRGVSVKLSQGHKDVQDRADDPNIA
jgi:hypothetical protein